MFSTLCSLGGGTLVCFLGGCSLVGLLGLTLFNFLGPGRAGLVAGLDLERFPNSVVL